MCSSEEFIVECVIDTDEENFDEGSDLEVFQEDFENLGNQDTDPVFRDSVMRTLEDASMLDEKDSDWEPDSPVRKKSRRGGTRKRGRGRARARRVGRSQSPDFPSSSTANWHWQTFGEEVEENPNISAHPFKGKTGPARWVLALQPVKAVDFFRIFWDKEISTYICRESNKYAEKNTKRSSRGWKTLTKARLDAFLGLSIAQGLDRRGEVTDYWSTNSWLHTPWYSEMFSVNDFLLILQNLHCCDNEKYDPTNKLFKMDYVIRKIQENCREAYTPGQKVSIDEQMIGTKCRIAIRQYMPKKPKKFGIKVWVLAESGTGYCSRFQIYTGKVDGCEAGLPSRVVHDLTHDLRHKGYHLYFDNFYTSPALCEELLDNGILCCGTVRVNRRGIPPQIKPAARDGFSRGEILFMKSQSLTAVRWKDKRDVTALSTMHCNQVITIQPRRDEQQPIKKPAIIVDYNNHMGGVDLLDQNICYYSLGRKSIKWWKRVFWRMIDIAIINAHVLYMAVTGEKIFQKKFREELIRDLTEEWALLRGERDAATPSTSSEPSSHSTQLTPGRHGRRAVPSLYFRLHGAHHTTTTRDGGIRRTCRVCGHKRDEFGRQSKKKTNHFCTKCQFYLCKGGCWNEWHSSKYK